MKIIKRPLVLGERIICKSGGKEVYRGVVAYINKTDVTTAYIEREDGSKKTNGKGWKVEQQGSKSWDGCFAKVLSNRGWNSYPTWTGAVWTGAVNNYGTGGSYLYTDKIDIWKKEFSGLK